jgi:N4-gp56 family major capsid protein
MADVLTTTTQLTQEMQVHYDSVFLETADLVKKYSILATKKTIPKNGGVTVQFTRTTHFAVVTTALTEGTNPTAVGFSAANVTATVAEWGFGTKISSLFSLSTIDSGLKQKVKELGYHAGLTLDTELRRIILAGATVQYAGGKTNITDVNSTDTFSATELRKGYKTLFTNAAPTFENGLYRAIVSPTGQYQLQGDTTTGNWVNANIYNDGSNAELVKKGVLGRLMGFDIVPTNNSYSAADVGAGASTTGYREILAGMGAVAEVDIAGQGGDYIIHKVSGPTDTSNPLNMFQTLAWKVDSYAAVVLNANWILNVIHQ